MAFRAQANVLRGTHEWQAANPRRLKAIHHDRLIWLRTNVIGQPKVNIIWVSPNHAVTNLQKCCLNFAKTSSFELRKPIPSTDPRLNTSPNASININALLHPSSSKNIIYNYKKMIRNDKIDYYCTSNSNHTYSAVEMYEQIKRAATSNTLGWIAQVIQQISTKWELRSICQAQQKWSLIIQLYSHVFCAI